LIRRAAKICIAEVEELVEPGQIKPEDVHLPGIYVDRILKGEVYLRRIYKGATESDEPEMAAYLKQFDGERRWLSPFSFPPFARFQCVVKKSNPGLEISPPPPPPPLPQPVWR
jgi:hypothetical protein